jgi:uncharacterized protein YkwD
MLGCSRRRVTDPRAAGRPVLVMAGALALLSAVPAAEAGPGAVGLGQVRSSAPATARLALGGGCGAARARPSRTAAAALRRAALCLVNRNRARYGLRALRSDRHLRRAAGRHAHDMVRRHYFAHQRSGGPSMGGRARAAGWRGRTLGEAIAYGCGRPATARAIVRGWMASPPHRAIILSRAYGRAGIGVARRAPVRCSNGATWVLDVGGG